MRAGAEKCEGALIGRRAPAPPRARAPRTPPRESLRERSVQGRLRRRAPSADLFGFHFYLYNLMREQLQRLEADYDDQWTDYTRRLPF